MVLKIKSFYELSLKELYEILRLRAEAFIVEQGGRYQDLDRTDYESIHIFFENDDGSVSACLRIYENEKRPETATVGRVVSADRLKGTGKKLMQAAERIAKERFGAKYIYITGRKSALGFYLKCGYRTVSEELGGKSSPYYEFLKEL